MRKNAVVEALEEIVGTDAIEYISGDVLTGRWYRNLPFIGKKRKRLWDSN